jgi:FkbM family methyltransferase
MGGGDDIALARYKWRFGPTGTPQVNTLQRIKNKITGVIAAPTEPEAAADFLMGRVFDLEKREIVELPGYKMFVMPDDHIGGVIAATKEYEPHVTRALRSTLARGHTFLDVGANIGFFSMMAASIVGSTGHVYSIEPNPQNVQLILESARTNGFEAVTLFPVAASDKYSILGMYNRGSNGGVITEKMRTAEVPIWPPNPSFYAQAVKIDDILSHVGRIDVVKIDIEAHEPEAMRGMTTLMARHRPIIFTEFHPWALSKMTEAPPVDYLHQVVSLGYRLSIITMAGEPIPTTPSEVMKRWASQARELDHFDLVATPS